MGQPDLGGEGGEHARLSRAGRTAHHGVVTSVKRQRHCRQVVVADADRQVRDTPVDRR